MARPDTRERIVEAADRLFYEQGFEAVSFGGLADEIGISRGNFYYHFKTKDEILEAVIARRMARTQALLEQWEAEGEDPEARIICFIRILIANRARIRLYGCPVGTLTAELGKMGHPALPQASALFTLFRDWLSAQFAALGRAAEADALAMHLLARSQGVAALAQAFQDDAFAEAEVAQMTAWLSGILRDRS